MVVSKDSKPVLSRLAHNLQGRQHLKARVGALRPASVPLQVPAVRMVPVIRCTTKNRHSVYTIHQLEPLCRYLPSRAAALSPAIVSILGVETLIYCPFQFHLNVLSQASPGDDLGNMGWYWFPLGERSNQKRAGGLVKQSF